MFGSTRVRCGGCGRETHAVETCEGCGGDLCGQCAERGKCPCRWTEAGRAREASIRARVLRQLSDGAWHQSRQVQRAGASHGITTAEVRAVIVDLVWADALEDRVTHEGPTEQRCEWLKIKIE